VTLPTGLVPVAAFALTVGVSTSVTVGAHLLARAGNRTFPSVLRTALAGTGLLYLFGVGIVWLVANPLAATNVAAVLVVAGAAAFAIVVALPLFVGRRLVERATGVDSATALGHATTGLPVAALVVFAIFVAPGGLATNAISGLGETTICLASFCGIARGFAIAVFVQLFVATVGPGLVGFALALSSAATGETRAQS
jgi:hypothetical protein